MASDIQIKVPVTVKCYINLKLATGIFPKIFMSRHWMDICGNHQYYTCLDHPRVISKGSLCYAHHVCAVLDNSLNLFWTKIGSTHIIVYREVPSPRSVVASTNKYVPVQPLHKCIFPSQQAQTQRFVHTIVPSLGSPTMPRSA